VPGIPIFLFHFFDKSNGLFFTFGRPGGGYKTGFLFDNLPFAAPIKNFIALNHLFSLIFSSFINILKG